MNKILFIEPDEKLAAEFQNIMEPEEFEVNSADSMEEAQNLLESYSPAGVIFEARLPESGSISRLKQLRESSPAQDIFFIALSEESDVNKRVNLIESGVDDYIQKPFEVEELLFRIRMLLRERKNFIENGPVKFYGFNGLLSEMNVIDLIQTLELGKKSGVIVLNRGAIEGKIFIKDGVVWDAAVGPFKGEPALYQLVLWMDGNFSVTFQKIHQEQGIFSPVQEVIQRSIQLIDEKERLLAHLPSIYTIFEQVRDLFPDELYEVTNEILSHVDDVHTLQDILDETTLDELDALREIIRLYQLGVLRESVSYRLSVQQEPSSAEQNPEVEQDLESTLISRTFDAIQNFFNQMAASEIRQSDKDEYETVSKENGIVFSRKLALSRSELQFIKHKLL